MSFSDNAYDIASLLETIDAIVEFFIFLKCPREVRFFSREIVVVTQKLLLPLRCSNYLIHLSQADLSSNKLDDCRVKLGNISDILNFNKDNITMYQDANVKSDFEFESLVKDLDDMHISSPGNKREASSSPILSRENARYPDFAYHEKNCECFCCNCVEYYYLVMEKIRLEAMLNMKQKYFTCAKKSFDSGLNLYHFYAEKSKSYHIVSSTKFHPGLVPHLIDECLPSYAKLLLDFTKFLMTVNKKELAEVINEKLLKILKPWKLKFMFLYNDVLLHKVALLADFPRLVVPLPSPEENSEEILRTPEHKQNEVSVEVQVMSPCSPITKIPKKRLEFETSPEDNNNRKLSSERKGSTVTRKGLFPCLKEPPACKSEPSSKRKPQLKSSHIPKIKIYSEDEDTDVKKKGKITRPRGRPKKLNEIFESNIVLEDIPQTSKEVRTVHKTYSSRKN